MNNIIKLSMSFIFLLFATCAFQNNKDLTELNNISESYVKLVLKIGIYDSEYIDACFAPEKLYPSSLDSNKLDIFPYNKFKSEVNNLITRIEKINYNDFDDLYQLRYRFLSKLIMAVNGKIEILNGTKMSFDEESKIIYDAIAPKHNEEYFKGIVNELNELLPGEGSINERMKKFKKDFIIPKSKIDTVTSITLLECRNRTLSHLKLPEENVIVEYVKNNKWSAYHYYNGNGSSLIQINTQYTVYINDVIDIISHEIYPGHHVHFTLLDKYLYQKNGWVEFSINPRSPLSFIAEGIATYSKKIIFPNKEYIDFERDIICPLAGLNLEKLEDYYKMKDLTKNLRYVYVETARRYLDGIITQDEAKQWLMNYLFIPENQMDMYLNFFEKNRSYIINYVYGMELIQNYIEKVPESNIDERWKQFFNLLSRPIIPSDLSI